MKAITINKRKLTEYSQHLSERDKAILRTLKICKYAKTDQMRRLHFGDTPSPKTTLQTATRNLFKLHKLGLVCPLRRRIGGARAGSSSYVWVLKAAGLELLRMAENSLLDEENPPAPPNGCRKRVFEPTFIFLKHTLEISELYVRLFTSKKLVNAEFEPSCWRGYTTAFGANVTIKPDLYAITRSGKYEDHWFFEVDLNTESPSRIVRKCEIYGRYCLTESEQKRIGVFPRVVWLVTDEKRRESLWRHISKNACEYADLFVVITFEGLEALISTGAAPSGSLIKSIAYSEKIAEKGL